MIRSLLYVSRKTIARAREVEEIAYIDKVSRSRNARLDITGTLVSADAFFAQRLEGPDAAITTLMASIAADPRHRDVTVVEDHVVSMREFSGWTLSYFGPSSFIAKQINALLEAKSPAAKDINALSRMVRELGAGSSTYK